jgi:hypothetical protein
MGVTEDSKALMWRITDEIWNNGRLDLIDVLIAEDLVDHVEVPGLVGSGRARYRASIELMRAASRTFATRWTSSSPTVRSLFRMAAALERIAVSFWGTADRSDNRCTDVRHPALS